VCSLLCMPNPHPVQSEALKAKWFKPQGEVTEKLAKRPVAVKLPESIDRLVRSKPQCAAWLRRVITEAVEQELLTQNEEARV
jgi:hypothetical protein